ncbi:PECTINESTERASE [Salix koriyanagi]|uniref:Pectinesterase n=1 Tax=Salix koriyanagi TaxID=2511006 RepID=A0A9Q0VYC6_9ROSI|nr:PECTINESTERASE [Salix koriyanagi]
MQACSNIENLTSCLSNFQAELGKSGPPTAHSIIHAALRATLDEARRSIDMITKFNSLSVSYREQIAIEDCKELLDFSVSELAWSLMEMSKIRAGVRNVHYEGNLKAWLSAALSNPDTCLEGFEGTDRHLENFISGSLKQVTQLIGNVLALYTQLHSLPFKPPRNDNATATKSSSDEFPEWMTEGDQELLRGSSFRYIIYVKKGVYRENIDMKRKKSYIMFVGDGIGKTVVTGNRNFMQGWTTFRTATVAVSGKGFIARDMTFRNTAGPLNHQAVALRVDSDQSAFYRCSMEGYQDTLYAHSLRQFYRECEIYGTIDYIFGNGAAVFQNCKIYTRVPLPLQKVTITAQGRKNPHQSTGFSIQDSYIFATQPTYLGRPWKAVFQDSFHEHIHECSGPASRLARVVWQLCIGHIVDASTAKFFTVAQFIDGMSWLPSTGIKFTVGLGN